MLSQINAVKNALLTVTESELYHYQAYTDSDRYIVWAEDNEFSSVEADNKKVNQTIEGTIDLYTKTEEDDWIESIQNALETACISFRLNTVQFEEETEFIHYEWIWQVGV